MRFLPLTISMLFLAPIHAGSSEALNLAALEAKYSAQARHIQKLLEPFANGACMSGSDSGQAKKAYRAALSQQAPLARAVLDTMAQIQAQTALGMAGEGEQNKAYEQVIAGVQQRKAMLLAAEARLAAAGELQGKVLELLNSFEKVTAPNEACLRTLAAAESGLIMRAGDLGSTVGEMKVALGQRRAELVAYEASLTKLHGKGTSLEGNQILTGRTPASAGVPEAVPAKKNPKQGNTITGLAEERRKKAQTEQALQPEK